MRANAMAFVALLALLQGCALFSKKDRPVNVAVDAPEVSNVIAQVQAAIDATSQNPAWGETPAYQGYAETCDTENAAERKEHDKNCAAAYPAARQQCTKEKGTTAIALCADYLREAAATCARPVKESNACEEAKVLAPVKIRSAKFKFAAATSKSGELGASLKLMTLKQARSYGRSSTYEIELVPRPKDEQLGIFTRKGGETDVFGVGNLTAVLLTALNAADVACVEDNSNRRARAAVLDGEPPKKCTIKADTKAPQLVLKSATYSVEITYTKKTDFGWEWSVSSLKLTGGGGALGSEDKLGNTLTLVLER